MADWQSNVDAWVAANPNATDAQINAAISGVQGASYNPVTRNLTYQGQSYNPWAASTGTPGDAGAPVPFTGGVSTTKKLWDRSGQFVGTRTPEQLAALNQISNSSTTQVPTVNDANPYTGGTKNTGQLPAPTAAPSAVSTPPPTNTPGYGLPGATGAQLGQNLYPAYWENLTSNVANYGAGLPSQIMDTYSNWYQGDLAAAPHQNTLAAAQQAAQMALPEDFRQGSGALGAANPYLQKAGEVLGKSAQYDPNELQKYLNPYTQQAAEAVTSQANRNLTESVLPQINSTFAGQGQFGSSRNAEFTNRALRDNQEAVAKALAQANYGAYDSANKYYSDWANKATAAGQGLTQLGGQQINLGAAYGQLGTQQSAAEIARLAALGKTGSDMQQLQQTEYDKVYNDWLTQQKYPAAMMGGLGSLVGSMAGGVRPDQLQTSAGSTAGMSDNARYAAALKLLGAGASDADVQKLLGGLFNWNT